MDSPKLTLLGIGNSEALKFWNTNCLVEGDGKKILLDCGFTIKYALRDVGLALRDIDAVYISHVHGDHVFGLERIAYEFRYTYQKSALLFIEPELESVIWDHCLKGSMGSSNTPAQGLRDWFEVRIIQDHQFEYAGCHFKTFPTPHTPGKASYGVIINNRVVFTSDTNVIPWLAEHDFQCVIHDCDLSNTNPVHANLCDIVTRYPQALLEKLVLVHFDENLLESQKAELDTFPFKIGYQGQEIAL